MPKGVKGYQKGHKGFLTPEHYQKIGKKVSIANRGKKWTPQQRARWHASNKNRVPWNKGLKTGRNSNHSKVLLSKNTSCLFSDSLRLHVECSGIYSIINRNTGKIYIGSSVNMMARLNQHRSTILREKHNNRYLRRAILKEPDAFEFSIVEYVADVSKLEERETFWIKFFQSNHEENGYNLAPVGGSNRGVKFSDEARANISAGLRKRWGSN
jgi:GIY-YIG catalytic domain-containing protein